MLIKWFITNIMFQPDKEKTWQSIVFSSEVPQVTKNAANRFTEVCVVTALNVSIGKYACLRNISASVGLLQHQV